MAIEAIERRIARHKAQTVTDVPPSTDVKYISTDVSDIKSEPSIGQHRTDIDQQSSAGQADEGPVAHEEGGPPGG